MRVLTLIAAWAALLLPMPAQANDDAFEFWLNPSVSVALDGDTGLELETAQRLRSRSDGQEDTNFFRLWLNQDVSDQVSISGGAERRFNTPGSDETRLLQQVSTAHGILRTRNRLEQRFVDGRRLGLRYRPRLGVKIPLDQGERWSFFSDAELFFTLRSTSRGGDDGLTGLRTQIGVSREVSDHLSVSLAYLRAQSIASGAPDEVGHAPLIGIELSF